MELHSQYLESVKKLLLYYKTLGEKAIEQIDENQLFATWNDNTNSISVIIKHLHGNMLSRWTDFLTTDGEKPWRNRDDEFIETYTSKTEVLAKWEEGWKCLFDALQNLKPEEFSTIVYIRNEGHTVVDALNRQLAHYSYHVGQIVFYAKLLKQSEWNSLTIPKNQSKTYNSDKFSKEKHLKSFTEDELKRLQ
ncbi:MAG: DUF1572 family protein [Flavobacteriaceae bacterium]